MESSEIPAFGAALARFRTQAGLSQQKLADQLGKGRRSVAAWEGGEYLPKAKGDVLELARILRLNDAETTTLLKAAGIDPSPKIWNVPYPRNPYFIGRNGVLDSLQQRLVPGAEATALTQSISGLGGIGKTQVAVEYAHRYGEYYEAVLWIQADSQETATVAYLQLASQVLGLREQQKAEQQIAEVKCWLQKHHGWLLIFDNVEDPEAILSTFIPSKHRGSVLITTRRRDVGTLAHSEVLPLLSEDDAVLFLLRRSGLIARNAPVTKAISDDFFLARNLCQLLDRLPLALDQAGAYIMENGGSLQHYIDLYHQFRPTLLNRRNADDQTGRRNRSDHPDSVLMTFSIAWDQIQQRNMLAGKALQFCSFLAPDQIPEELVLGRVIPLKDGSTKNVLEIDEALGLLHRYSLVERRKQTLSLHRLVQEVMQDVLSEEEWQQWAQWAVHVLAYVFPSGEYGTWERCETLLPHALQGARWIAMLKQRGPIEAHLLAAIGSYITERGQYADAEPLLQRALTITENQVGLVHPDTAGRLNNLAELYRKQGRYAEAESLYQRALTIAKKQLGPEHLQTAISLNNLAELYRQQGRYMDAEPLYQRALAICEEQLGHEHSQTAIILHNLALLYQSQGRYAEALPLLQRALPIAEKQWGPTHPYTAASLLGLGGLYRLQGHYAKAEPLYQRALSIDKELLGSEHPYTAGSLHNLATLYQQQGRYAEAEPLYQQALAICEEQLGPDHPSTATSLGGLADLYYSQGRYAEAEPLYQRALAICEKQLGSDHPSTALSLSSLATLYEHQGHYAEGESLYQRALAICEKQLGPMHPQTAQILNNLASIYHRQKKYMEAEQFHQRALSIRKTQLGVTHPDTGESLNNLATLYKDQDRHMEAEPLLKQALTICEEQLGPMHPQTAIILNNLATFYVKQGRYVEAEPLLKRALFRAGNILGAKHPLTRQFLGNYLQCLDLHYTNGDLDTLLIHLKVSSGEDDC